MRKIQNLIVLICIVCTGIFMSSCQPIVQTKQPWEQVDIALEVLPVLKTEKREITISENFQQNHIAVLDKNGSMYFANTTDLDMVEKTSIIAKGSDGYSSYWYVGDRPEQVFYPNELLTPQTFIGGSLSAILPMELFMVQQESVQVDYQDQQYSILQGGKLIMNGTMIAYHEPWVLTTQHPINHQDEKWEYIVLNTESKYSVSIVLPGLIQSVEKIDNHLLLKVVDQVFFRTSQWVFLPKENRVVSLGSNYAEIQLIGEFPESNWCIVSDWYNRELSVRNRSTYEKLYTLPLDKYMVSGITSFQDNNHNWHVWIIPVLTVENFTSNVFWISLKKNQMKIQNLDYHEPFLVSTYRLDSEGNLFMIEEKPFNQEWDESLHRWIINGKDTIKHDTIILKINPWSQRVQKLPVVWDAESKQDKKLILVNPNIEMKPEGILVRDFYNPYYIEAIRNRNYWNYMTGIAYKEKIVIKTKKETIQVLDPMTLKPLNKEMPVSDIVQGMSWTDFFERGIQDSLLVPYNIFDASDRIINDDI